MNMKKYDAFLFDADNTLYDFNKASAAALEFMFAENKLDFSDNIPADFFDAGLPFWAALERGELSYDQVQIQRFNGLFETIGAKLDAAAFDARYQYELGKSAVLIDGALEICRGIMSNNKHIFIITNGFLACHTARAKYSAIHPYISDSFISEVIGFSKPAKGFFDHVLANIPFTKEKILIVGDSLSADIAGGNMAGIDTCWFNLHGIDNNTGTTPTYEIRKLFELEKFI